MHIRQFLEEDTHTYTYLVWDARSKEAILIDSTLAQVERDLRAIKELGLDLRYILETHVHADHVTGASEIRKVTGAKIALSEDSGAQGADIYLKDGQTLRIGSSTLTALATPGHTDGCMSFHVPGYVFSGDALLIRGCGRTDFQQGSSEKLFASVTHKIFSLPDETVVYPAHDYKGVTSSTVGEEKKWNPRLSKSKEQFVEIMSALKLEKPRHIDVAVPRNLRCGDAS